MLEPKNINNSNNNPSQSAIKAIGLGNIVALVFFTLFWNGFVAIVYIQMFSALLLGRIQLILVLLFLTPFIGVGIRHMLIPLILILLKSLGIIRSTINLNLKNPDLPRSFPPISFWGGAVQLTVAIVMVVMFFFSSLTQFINIRGWEPVPCEIISSKIIELPGEKEKQYTVDVRYRYKYSGRNHTSEKLSLFQPPVKSLKSSDKIVKKYPAETRSICYVNPSNPEEAILSRDIRGLEFARGGMGGLLFLFSALILGVGTRRWVKDNRPKTNHLQRPERILFWALLLFGWGVFTTAMIIGDICKKEAETSISSTPELKTVLFLGIIGAIFLYKLLYNIFYKWDRVTKLTQEEFYTMYKQIKKNKDEDDEGSP